MPRSLLGGRGAKTPGPWRGPAGQQDRAPYDEQLNTGEVILGGSFTRPTTAVAGDTLQADDAPLGTVSFHFV